MRRELTPGPADGKRLRFVVIGQCAFTALVVRRLLRLNVPPAQVILQNGAPDPDPFEGMKFTVEPRWHREHRYYHHEWRREVRDACAAAGVPLREKDDVFDGEIGGDGLLVAGLARRVPETVLRRFGAAALNAHTSLLPGFAGPQPEAQVILRGVCRSGVTIHTMTPRFDDGPIRYQASYTVPPDATVGSLERRGAVLAASGIARLTGLPIADWPVIPAEGPRSYHRWYDAADVLDLSRCGSVEQASRVLRLRPEGYAYLDEEVGRVYPIRQTSRVDESGRTLRCPDGALPVAEWITLSSGNNVESRC